MYLSHHTKSIDDITATICMISHPLYVRHSILNIYDIVSTMYDMTMLCVDYTTLGLCMTSFVLQKTSNSLYHTNPQSLWLHIHFRPDITLPVSDIAPTVSLSSQPLHWYHTHFCMTWHPLHVWHHMHYIEHDIHCLCHHPSVLRTAQTWHMKPHALFSSKCTLSKWHHSHLSVSSHPRYWEHHTHSLYDIKLGICIASFAL